MGKPSDKQRSARRPGRRERARVKNKRRGKVWRSDWGAGTAPEKLGRKKMTAFIASSIGGLLNRTSGKTEEGPHAF